MPDHTAEAEFSLKIAAAMAGEGHTDSAATWTGFAAVHAQLAGVEQSRRLADLLDKTMRGDRASIGISGHVTTGLP